MINEISYLSDSNSNAGMSLSYGEYNTESGVLRIWVYQTRFTPVFNEDGASVDSIIKIRDLQSPDFKEYLKSATGIELVDLDWDARWLMPKKYFKKAEVVDGYKSFYLSKLIKQI